MDKMVKVNQWGPFDQGISGDFRISIADIAIMNDLLSQEEIEVERYTDRDSKFYQKYESLLDNLDFHAC